MLYVYLQRLRQEPFCLKELLPSRPAEPKEMNRPQLVGIIIAGQQSIPRLRCRRLGILCLLSNIV